jgi:predicted ribosomally synthesized peptide with nif11-like leader
MSIESAKTFIEKVKEDEALQEKLKAVDSEENFFAVVKEAGFDFTKEEWGEFNTKKEGTLSETELSSVAGGDLLCMLAGSTAGFFQSVCPNSE